MAPFSIATAPRWRGECYSFPSIIPLCPRSIPYNAECKARRYQVPFFESLVLLDLGIIRGLLVHWRTLWPYIYIYIYIYIYDFPLKIWWKYFIHNYYVSINTFFICRLFFLSEQSFNSSKIWSKFNSFISIDSFCKNKCRTTSFFLTSRIYFSLFNIWLYHSSSVRWKVQRLTKKLWWKVIKWGVFFCIILPVVHVFFVRLFQSFDLTGKKIINDIIIWTF